MHDCCGIGILLLQVTYNAVFHLYIVCVNIKAPPRETERLACKRGMYFYTMLATECNKSNNIFPVVIPAVQSVP